MFKQIMKSEGRTNVHHSGIPLGLKENVDIMGKCKKENNRRAMGKIQFQFSEFQSLFPD